MEIMVYAKQFQGGVWNDWERLCSEYEVEAVVDTAAEKACERTILGEPSHDDILAGARYIFDVARGTAENPRDGDTCVYGVCVNGIVIGDREKLNENLREKIPNYLSERPAANSLPPLTAVMRDSAARSPASSYPRGPAKPPA
jgi:hypothetical protein